MKQWKEVMMTFELRHAYNLCKVLVYLKIDRFGDK